MAKKKSVEAMIDPQKVSNYKRSDVKTASGRKSIDCDDTVARKLRGKNQKELAAVARDEGLGDRWKSWSHLNDGQRRMALGNAMRAAARPANKAKAKAKVKAVPKRRARAPKAPAAETSAPATE